MLTVAEPLADTVRFYQGYLDRQWRLNRISHKTVLEYTRIARRFLAFYRDLSIDAITPEHIEHYLIARLLSPRSKVTELMRLRSFFRWIVRDERLLRDNPCSHVDKPRWQAGPRPAISEREFVAICRAARTLEELTLIEVLYHTGLRVRELGALRVEQVDLARRRMLVTGKGGRKDYVFFPPHVADLLQTHIDWPPLQSRGTHGSFAPERAPIGASFGGPVRRRASSEGWLFPSPTNRGVRQIDWIERLLHRLGREVGLPYHLTAHLLRHGLARTLKLTEMPLAAIQRIMRHQNIQTTINLYGRLLTDDVQGAYDRYMNGRA